MTQPAPPSWSRPQPHHAQPPRSTWPQQPPSYGPERPAWPVAYAIQPAHPVQPAPFQPAPFRSTPFRSTQPDSGAFRWVALACGTLLVVGALVLAGFMLLPRTSPVVVAAGSSSPVVAPVAAPTTDVVVPAGGYSCGSASGHAVIVENGTVPCDHARSVASQWLGTGTTPGYGAGSAGTMYSWTCSSTSAGTGWCTSKMGSHLAIGS